MNELIEKLWDKFSDDYDMRKSEFKQAIQEACQAQRNACVRSFRESEEYTEVEFIKNAEITKADYE